MVLKNRSKSKSKSRSNGHTQIPTQLVIPVQKRRTHHTDKSESENEDETGIENDGHDRNELLNIWRSFPTTVPHLLAFLNLVYAVLISSIIKFEIGARETIMGLTDWLSSRGVTAEGDRDGTERLGMMERMPGEDVTQAQARRDGVENKQIRRRRHEIQERAVEELEYFPGMVNLSGTLCYMNSVLQAFASVTSLFTQLEKIVQLALEVDYPTPVTDALLEVLYDLNTTQKRQPPAIRPIALLNALQPLPAIRRLLSTREQQDAHELFLVLAEAVSDEALKVASEIATTRGLGEILSLQGYVAIGQAHNQDLKSHPGQLRGKGQDGGQGIREKKRGLAMPWEGLMARRRVCRTCGWCESIRMDTLGGMELAIPLTGDVAVEQCIAQYLSPESLSDVTCEMCSLRQTLQYYTLESTRLSSPASTITNGHAPTSHTKSGSFSALEHVVANTNGLEPDHPSPMSTHRKKKLKEARRVESRLREMLEAGTVTHFGESTLPIVQPDSAQGSSGTSTSTSTSVPIKWQTARTNSVREAAITRPPQSLRLHFIRSEYTPYGQLLKKNARVSIPLILDLTRFVANGVWEERNVMGMLNGNGNSNGNGNGTAFSKHSELDVESRPQPAPAARPQTRVLYRLESVILHYGATHSSGHYICIRRKPLPSDDDAHRPRPVSKSCSDDCICDSCKWFGQVRNDTGPSSASGPGSGNGNGNGSGTGVAGKGWLRISDADVDEVGIEALMDARAAVFMVFYEKVGEYRGNKS